MAALIWSLPTVCLLISFKVLKMLCHKDCIEKVSLQCEFSEIIQDYYAVIKLYHNCNIYKVSPHCVS